MKKVIILCLIFVVVLSLSCLRLFGDERVLKVEHTCTEYGYSVYKNRKTGNEYIKDYVSPREHNYINRIIKNEDDYPGLAEMTCSNCGESKTHSYFDNLEICKLCIYGDLDGIGKKAEAPVIAEFHGINSEFDSFATIKWQGHSSLMYDKKNYTIKFFKDELRSEKQKMSFEDWHPENKYILKANYIDLSSCRNLVCANIWGEIVKNRNNVPKELAKLSNGGAIEGFPIILYINDEFSGIYNFNLHKDDDLFELEDSKKQALVICNRQTKDESLFKNTSNFDKELDDWEIEECMTDDDYWCKERMNELLFFVANSDAAEFKNNIDEYLDIDAAIDYMLAFYSLGLTSSFAKDMVLVTYDGSVFIPSMYDMENAFGLSPEGEMVYGYDYMLPEINNGEWISNTDSLLWDKLLNSFEDEIKERYKELRKSVLTESNVHKKIEEITSKVDERYYEKDIAIYKRNGVSSKEQIETYFENRVKLLDLIFMDEGE